MNSTVLLLLTSPIHFVFSCPAEAFLAPFAGDAASPMGFVCFYFGVLGFLLDPLLECVLDNVLVAAFFSAAATPVDFLYLDITGDFT